MTNVLKATGEIQPFSEEKIVESIKRAGVSVGLQDKALTHVKQKVYENIPTAEIYQHINEFLDIEQKPVKLKYGLKQAIMKLGPTGYPFEDYVSEILKRQGYQTEVRSIVSGICISYEIDVVAQKDDVKLMVEAKFHNTSGIRTDVHVSLYTKARFDDIAKKHNFTKAFLYTNTKITPDALTYASCVDMGVVSWSYPENGSLRDFIETEKLYPITLLDSLSIAQLQTLLVNQVVLVSQICKDNAVLDFLNLQEDKKQNIISQARTICEI